MFKVLSSEEYTRLDQNADFIGELCRHIDRLRAKNEGTTFPPHAYIHDEKGGIVGTWSAQNMRKDKVLDFITDLYETISRSRTNFNAQKSATDSLSRITEEMYTEILRLKEENTKLKHHKDTTVGLWATDYDFDQENEKHQKTIGKYSLFRIR